MNKLPSFICVGAQKAGTTTLHDILKQHPDIFLPDIKETKFFRDTDKYEQGVSFYSQTHFSDAKNNQLIGEIDPEYIYFDEIPKRILDTLGSQIKFIFIFRNPVSRAFSHYEMSKLRGLENLTFLEAIEAEKERIKKGSFEKNHFSYIDRGFYAQQLKRYLQLFPKENMLFIRFEDDLLKNPEQTVDRIFKFLDVKYHLLNTNLKSNSAGIPKSVILNRLLFQKSKFKNIFRLLIPKVEYRTKLANILYHWNRQKNYKKSLLDSHLSAELIKNVYAADIQELENLTKLNFSTWYKGIIE